jgi:cytochrome b
MRARDLPYWDPLVRITHWWIAAAVILNALILEEGEVPHVWVGYAAAGLLALRLAWGVFGVGAARFATFPPDPFAALRHVRAMWNRQDDGPYPSHNPLGALMAYALWAMLAIVVVTGIAMKGDPFAPMSDTGQLRWEQHEDTEDHDREDDGEELLEEVHELAANLLLVLSVLHVGGVIFESRRIGRNLVGPMTWRARR